MFLRIGEDLVNMENVLTIKESKMVLSSHFKKEAIEKANGVIIYFVDGSTSTYPTSLEEVADALDELGVML